MLAQPLYESCHNGSAYPTTGQLESLLSDVITNFSQCYLLIDALDETEDSDKIRSLIEELSNNHTHLKLFLTSRDNFDVEESIEDCLKISITPDNISHDVQSYIRGRIGRSKRLGLLNIDEVVETLETGAAGM
jgi:hypothetical protein